MHDEADPDKERKLVDQTLDDHAETMQAVTHLEAILDRHPDPEGKWIAEIIAELPRLSQVLRCHFGEEQEGPLYREIPVRRPRFAERLRRLEAEHARIVRAVEGAIALGRELEDPPLHKMREFNAQLQLLVAQIRRHEAEENEVLLEAYWDEVGTGD